MTGLEARIRIVVTDLQIPLTTRGVRIGWSELSRPHPWLRKRTSRAMSGDGIDLHGGVLGVQPRSFSVIHPQSKLACSCNRPSRCICFLDIASIMQQTTPYSPAYRAPSFQLPFWQNSTARLRSAHQRNARIIGTYATELKAGRYRMSVAEHRVKASSLQHARESGVDKV
jgi:hypothetical protein